MGRFCTFYVRFDPIPKVSNSVFYLIPLSSIIPGRRVCLLITAHRSRPGPGQSKSPAELGLHNQSTLASFRPGLWLQQLALDKSAQWSSTLQVRQNLIGTELPRGPSSGHRTRKRGHNSSGSELLRGRESGSKETMTTLERSPSFQQSGVTSEPDKLQRAS
ncbi:hypothetical protein RRG08_057649 [Elysia crispata]|uniref:Uncharacterized protein n=1 Tax=Elysia crispata TaxID=231223 RepID=A0AAE1DQM6_9GAST|nr:hypothetical protein RRG08_057649 [Elysia crispata]